ncbi:MAG: DUF5722 domain-containing protein [Verrucomicrobiota bacterium]
MRSNRFLHFFLLWCCSVFLVSGVEAAPITKVDATTSEIRFSVENNGPGLSIVELAPNQTLLAATNSPALIAVVKKGNSTIAVPRFDGARDRIYSGFVGVENKMPSGSIRFVAGFKDISENRDSYPQLKSKKGLQVQKVDDAIALGVKHAAINFNLGQMVALDKSSNHLFWEMDGVTFYFHRSYIEGIDRQIKALSDAGAAVSLILLNYEGADINLNKILLHPNYDRACPNHLSAFNTSTSDGIAYFKAGMEFLTARYSKTGYPHGRVVNYIVGNEVNSHWYWANMGRVTMEQFAADYLRTVRLCQTAVRKFSSSARVFLSLEHHWNIRYAGCDEKQGFAGRAFIEHFNFLAKAGGNFDWDVAFHPYPENLFNPRTWNDQSATSLENTPRITFKNLEMLPRYLQRTEFLFEGKPRRIILSEQGFHSDGTPEGELVQAAAYCYAFYKSDRLKGIDAFILHRHVDHPHEGGLNLGLWRRDPMTKKPIYEVFRAADTPEWEKAFAFALPIIGIKSWKEIDPVAVGK